MLEQIGHILAGAPTIARTETGPITEYRFSKYGNIKYNACDVIAVFFAHAKGDFHPSFVIKIAKEPPFENLVRAEHEAVEYLWAVLGEDLHRTIPEPVALQRVEGSLVSIKTFLCGVPFLRYVRPGGFCHERRVFREVRLASEWRCRCRAATGRFAQVTPADAYVAELRDRYASKWGLSGEEKRLFDHLAAEMAGNTFSLLPAHGDFGPVNLLSARSEARVIDWMSYHPAAPPLSDLVNHLVARDAVGLSVRCPGQLLPLYRLSEQRFWFATRALEMLRSEALACAWPSSDLSTVLAVGLAFFAARTGGDTELRRESLARRAELFRDLARWHAESAGSPSWRAAWGKQFTDPAGKPQPTGEPPGQPAEGSEASRDTAKSMSRSKGGCQVANRPKRWDAAAGRLLFVGTPADASFWDEHWREYSSSGGLADYVRRSRADRIVGLAKRYADGGRILEGGCGIGATVWHLSQSGFLTYGVDNAPWVIHEVKNIMPDLNVFLGDVTKLTFPDGFFSLYFSLGLIEHFWRGYDALLREAHRVLKPGGHMVTTFVWLSPLRRFKAWAGMYPQATPGDYDTLYQFALATAEVKEVFVRSGFRVVSVRALGALNGLIEDAGPLSPLWRWIAKRETPGFWIKVVKTIIEGLAPPLCGHTCEIIARKNSG